MRHTRQMAAMVLGLGVLAPGAALAQSTVADGAQVAEIVVTAQRREERLSQVPFSVTALTGSQLEKSGVSGATDLALKTPGLQYPVSGAFAQPTIRGIGTTVTSAGSDANVALYIDGVYMPSQAGNIFDFNSIARIEVLKGPQGTLYGRNATGGAISITTLDPTPGLLGKVSASYGSFHDLKAQAFVNVGFGDRIAANLAYLHHSDGGYARDVLRGGRLATYDENAVRGKLRIEATDAIDLTLSADWARKTDLSGYTLKPYRGNVGTIGAIVPSDPRQFALSFQPDFETESRGVSAKGVYRLNGDYTVTALSSWRRVDAHFLTDLDRTQVAASRAEFETRQQTVTQELNLAGSPSDRFSFVAGAFYYYDRANNDNLRTNNVPGVIGMVQSRAAAAYVQGQYDLTDRLTLIAGTRYSSEERLFAARRPTPAATLEASKTWNAWTPRVSVRYALDDATNAYATYSRGFKSGTYNVSTFSGVPVNPESVDAFEVGVKHFRGGRSFNASAFHYTYDDIQIQAISLATGLTALTNAAQARIYGVEADFAWPITRELTLDGGAAYTHSEYNRFAGALLTTPRITAAQCGANPNRPCGNVQAPGDASGNTMIRSPEVTANLTLSYERPFAGGELEASATAYYNSGFYWDVGNRLKQPAYATLNGRLSWGPESRRWRIALWGRNLANELYAAYAVDTTAADAVAYARPRSVGVQLDLKFD
jgi:iron complex outermembrane receptor protein